jgi:hypothetical protein
MYTVTVEINTTGEVLVNEFATEREAVRRIETAQRYDNLKLVGHSDNIDVNAYRY